MLTISAARRARETARALEIDAAERALFRSRLRWFGVGLVVVALAYVPMVFAFHTADRKAGVALFWLAILIANSGPLVVLWCAMKSEEP
ncbi:MAG TPA: hypothetical protein VFI13_11195 [Gemmatimonadales bacterium]|nr:hypothetical protein [Gemmatimonadales bacterium]